MGMRLESVGKYGCRAYIMVVVVICSCEFSFLGFHVEDTDVERGLKKFWFGVDFMGQQARHEATQVWDSNDDAWHMCAGQCNRVIFPLFSGLSTKSTPCCVQIQDIEN